MCAALLSTVQNNWIVKIIPSEKFLNININPRMMLVFMIVVVVCLSHLHCQASFVWHEQSAPKCVICHIILLAYCTWILYLMLSFVLPSSFVLRMEWVNELYRDLLFCYCFTMSLKVCESVICFGTVFVMHNVWYSMFSWIICRWLLVSWTVLNLMNSKPSMETRWWRGLRGSMAILWVLWEIMVCCFQSLPSRYSESLLFVVSWRGKYCIWLRFPWFPLSELYM